MVSTTERGKHKKGRLTLHTSAENMPMAYKNLKPRWQISYRTEYQMIGSKPIGELAPATPGASFVYGSVELPALEPAYVEHGRRRPKDGPLIEAVDRFVGEKIRELARQINDRHKEQLDERSLDEVHEENRKLDEFKNRFLPNIGDGNGARGKSGAGPVTVMVVDRQNGERHPKLLSTLCPRRVFRSLKVSQCPSGNFLKRVFEIRSVALSELRSSGSRATPTSQLCPVMASWKPERREPVRYEGE